MDERVLEMAQAAQQERLQQAIDNRVVYQGESTTECNRCGDDIPEARRQAVLGCRFCVECQGLMEVRR